jgi:outer membrane protein OmpA-like peptidoglycan-associated protein
VKKLSSHIAGTLILVSLALTLVGCQYLADRDNDFADIFVLGGGVGGGVIFGPGGGIEAGLKATELLNISVGASEMNEIEIMNSSAQTYWESNLGFPFAPIYMMVTDTLPDPRVARRAVEGRWYLHSAIRDHGGPFNARWKSGVEARVPGAMRGQATETLLHAEGNEGLNSYMLISPFLDSELPLIDRFEIGGEATLLVLGGHAGVSLGQVADFAVGFLGFDPADDDGRRWLILRFTDYIRRITGPTRDLPPEPAIAPVPEEGPDRHPLFIFPGESQGESARVPALIREVEVVREVPVDVVREVPVEVIREVPVEVVREVEVQTPAPPAPEPEVVTEVVTQRIVTQSFTFPDVLFDYDQSTLNDQASGAIDQIVRAVGGQEIVALSIVGHTDNIGDDEYNQSLGERRAQAVANALAASGITHSEVEVISVGESQPRASNDTDWGRALNRRVEVHVSHLER